MLAGEIEVEMSKNTWSISSFWLSKKEQGHDISVGGLLMELGKAAYEDGLAGPELLLHGNDLRGMGTNSLWHMVT